MKNFLLFILLLCGTLTNAQKLDKIDFVDMSSYPDLSNYKSKIDVETLKLKDGSVLKKGDILILGEVSDNNNTSVFNGTRSTNYSYVFVNKFNIMNAMAAVAFSSSSKGTKFLVDEIFLYKSGKSKQVLIQFTKEDGGMIAMSKFGHIRDIEKALEAGEIINPNRAITREEAIKKLKESKDLLDLDMLTKDEYDKIKSELEPFIKGN